MSTAIYYQKSEVVQEEFKLIGVATSRELVVEKLQRVIRDVKERRRELDDNTILETFALFNRVREATIDIIRSISVWQESFTKPIRPRLFDCDYIIERLVFHIDFINGTNLKRIFNFQFYRGNFLLLPYPNPKSIDPIRISTALAKELRIFAAPLEETVLYCYQFMINCLPDAIYQDKVAPLKRWLMACWVPRVWVLDVKPTPQPVARPFLKRQGTAGTVSTSTPTGSRKGSMLESSSNGAGNGGGGLQRSKSADSSGGDAKSTKGSPPRLQRRPTQGSSGSNRPKGSKETEKENKNNTRIKRRNQMKEEETAQIKAIAVDTTHNQSGEEPTAGADGDVLDQEAKQQLEAYLQLQREKKEQEISGLDSYFSEMERLFTPTLGRRAVQTVVVGGTRTDNGDNAGHIGVGSNKEYREPVTHELFHQPERIVFHHTFKAATDALEEIAAEALVPEGAKRNRRHAMHKQEAQPVVDFSSYKRPFDRSRLLTMAPPASPFEVLFAVSDPNQKNADRETQVQSEKAASQYLRNKYNTGSTRRKSRDSGDGGSNSTDPYGLARRHSRRLSGITLDSSSVKSGEGTGGAGDATIGAPDKNGQKEQTDDEVPPPPADTPLSTASAVRASVKLPPVRGAAGASSSSPSSRKASPPPNSARLRSPNRKGLPAGKPVSILKTPSPAITGRKSFQPSVTISTSAMQPIVSPTAPTALVEEDTIGFEPDEPLDEAAEDAEARRQRRRESRRMSDLTVTFSIKSGGDGDGDGEEEATGAGEAVGVAASTDYDVVTGFSPLAGSIPRKVCPQRVPSTTAPGTRPGSAQHNHSPGRNRSKQDSPTRSPARARTPPSNGRYVSPGRSVTGSGGDGGISNGTSSRRGSLFGGSQSERSRGGTSLSMRSDGTNEYGIKVRAGTPPKASLSLTLTTEAMRLMFARVEDNTDAQSTATGDT